MINLTKEQKDEIVQKLLNVLTVKKIILVDATKVNEFLTCDKDWSYSLIPNKVLARAFRKKLRDL